MIMDDIYPTITTEDPNTKPVDLLEELLGLEPGTLDSLGNGDAIEGSALSTTVYLDVGDTVILDWNYLTNENPNSYYNDFAFVTNGVDTITLANTFSPLFPSLVPEFDLETGESSYSYTNYIAGTYNLAAGIIDVGDDWVTSGLLVENVVILPDNGSFETGTFDKFNPIGDVSIETYEIVIPEIDPYHAKMTNSTGSIPDDLLEDELGLIAGTLDGLGNGDATEGSALSRTMTVQAGDTVSFDWNYLTNEYPGDFYNDFAFVTNGVDTITLADTFSDLDPSSVPEFQWETGYSSFSYTFDTAGTYNLATGIVDVGDTIVDSALLVDNLTINPAVDIV